MIKSAHPLCKCGEIADGVDDDFCQDCWEAYCAQGWHEMMAQLPENLVCWPYQHTQSDDWGQIWTLSATTEQAIADIREHEGLDSDVIIQLASAMSPDRSVWE